MGDLELSVWRCCSQDLYFTKCNLKPNRNANVGFEGSLVLISYSSHDTLIVRVCQDHHYSHDPKPFQTLSFEISC